MFGLIKTWKALEAKGIMGINRRNADYVLKYNKRHLYPIVDDKIITKMRAIEAGIDVPEMYGIIQSRTTRSGCQSSIMASATWPSCACATSKPTCARL